MSQIYRTQDGGRQVAQGDVSPAVKIGFGRVTQGLAYGFGIAILQNALVKFCQPMHATAIAIINPAGEGFLVQRSASEIDGLQIRRTVFSPVRNKVTGYALEFRKGKFAKIAAPLTKTGGAKPS